MRQFKTAAHRGKAAVPNDVPIKFQWDDQTLTANPPSSGQFALLLSTMSDGEFALDSIRGLFDFLAAVMNGDDFSVIRRDLQDGVDVEIIVELIEGLIEEWSLRPTTPAAVSSRSRPRTGRSSTGSSQATA